MAKALFGTDGIRGKVNCYPITSELALKLGHSISQILPPSGTSKRPKVLIGRDTRNSGTMLEYAITSGLLAQGIDVYSAGVLPTPATAYLTEYFKCDAGIMVTASHNPYTDNGIKIFGPEGYKINDSQEDQLEQFLLSSEPAQVAKTHTLGSLLPVLDASEKYIDFIKEAISPLSLQGFHVVIDAAHGAASYLAENLFTQLGAQVTLMGAEPNGQNINHEVGSLHPQLAAQKVLQVGADMGICLDGDADRVIFIDHKGQIIDGDQILYFCALSLKKRNLLKGNSLVSTVMSNLGLKHALQKEGIDLIQTPVGDRHVLETMRQGNFNLGGENSGHLIFSDFAKTGDGLLSALKVASFVIEDQKSLHDSTHSMPLFPLELYAVEVSSKPPIEEVEGLWETIQKTQSTLGSNGRVLVRYSGTESKIRVLVEAKEASLVSQESQRIRACLLYTSPSPRDA